MLFSNASGVHSRIRGNEFIALLPRNNSSLEFANEPDLSVQLIITILLFSNVSGIHSRIRGLNSKNCHEFANEPDLPVQLIITVLLFSNVSGVHSRIRGRIHINYKNLIVQWNAII
jgi:hypothetical protein